MSNRVDFTHVGVDEAAPHRLDNAQNNGTRRRDSTGLPRYYAVWGANLVYPSQERYTHRHPRRRIQSVSIGV
jgi:hypothetical protein